MVDEQVVLVDKDDNQIGLMDKMEAHLGKGTLHRAISVLLYRKVKGTIEVLLQQRSKSKPLWPLFWTNTVCTHPRSGESTIDCAVRRLKEEMGIAIAKEKLRFVFKLLYQAQYTNNLAEHELDHVFVVEWDGKTILNPQEGEKIQWKTWNELVQDFNEQPEIYTPWLKPLVEDKRIIDFLENV